MKPDQTLGCDGIHRFLDGLLAWNVGAAVGGVKAEQRYYGTTLKN